MSDNVQVTAGSGTSIAADDVGGILYQRVKITYGADGSATDASSSNPLPTSAAQSGTWNITNISGTVSLPTGAATAANQSAANTALTAIQTAVTSTSPSPVQARNPDYETVAASATDQVMGASGAAGDYLSHVLITPATTSPGNVIIKDGSTTIFTFTGGASSVTTLIPFAVPLGLTAVTSWKITTGTNVSAIAVGDFT
jgi:hypothetical protein